MAFRLLLRPFAALFALSIASLAFAGGVDGKTVLEPSASAWQKPAWMTDLSLGVRESYDSNVYVSGADAAYYPATLPAGDLALKNRSSWATTLMPKVGVDLAKLYNSDSILRQFALGYASEITQFHNAPGEDFAAHRFFTAIKAKQGPATLCIDNALAYIDGSHEGLIYPGGSSSFCNSTVRERRDQWQERTKASLKVDMGPVFVRPTVSLLYYDLNTVFKNIPGYTNYVDRYDLNGGADMGYYIAKDMALTLGYRYGHQFQETLPFDPTGVNTSNNYQRVLFGFEGAPVKWLKVEAAVGPQFTTYTGQRPQVGGLASEDQINKNPADVYAEASLTMTPTQRDAFIVKYKRWNWVSSTGKNAYMDTCYDACYQRQLTETLQLVLGFKAGQADYNPSSFRNDWMLSPSIGLRYALTKNLMTEVAYTHDRGTNSQDFGIINGCTREFERNVVTTGVQWAF